MTNRLVIVGAGGFGREVHSWVKSSPRWCESSEIGSVVFVDDNVPTVPVRAPIISTVRDYWPAEGDLVICAIGAPSARRDVSRLLSQRNAPPGTFVHDRAMLGDNVQLGLGAIVCPDVLITCDVRIGVNVHVNIGSTIAHDVIIGDFVTLSPGCNLTGNVRIEDGAFLGTAVTVIPGKTVGQDALIGAGSLVLKNIPPRVTAFGNPCVIVGKRPA
ncbi:acetyltransferase [Cryobacterium sinapicolor]|uniref:Acetyltransferase n=1 Tax=Cryobacterium sinapicolor TaxID=1259236 RepID=A0ABY2ITT3_9MICO|nr:acetyltransferase [Cryobacterium sinapicolor]TFC94713.1 acetyltransferase [Cryobacterium sinapicolor]